MANQWGYVCPSCGDSEFIDVVAQVWVRLVEDGTDDSLPMEQAVEWDGNATAKCSAGGCDWGGKVDDLIVVESEIAEPVHLSGPNGCTPNCRACAG